MFIKTYRYCLSPFFGSACRFYPSCSEYAEASISKHGLARGGLLAVKRILRCHPWHEGGVDLVEDHNIKQKNRILL